MRSPIKDSVNNFKCLRYLQEMIPPGSVFESFLFFGGELEFSLSQNKRFCIAHTNRYVVYEFWKCLMEDSERVYNLCLNLQPHLQNENTFYVFQENWFGYKDPFVRSSLFSLLNRCSTSGLISAGAQDYKNFTPFALSYLKNFNVQNFHLVLDEGKELAYAPGTTEHNSEYLLFPLGRYEYNFFEQGTNKGFEMTTIKHRSFCESLSDIENNWIVLYKHHPEVHRLYKKYNIKMVDKYGRHTKEKDKCEDLIIANF